MNTTKLSHYQESKSVGIIIIAAIIGAFLITVAPLKLILSGIVAAIVLYFLATRKELFVYLLSAYTFSLIFVGIVKLPGGYIALLVLSWILFLWHYRPLKLYHTNTNSLLLLLIAWAAITLINAPVPAAGATAFRFFLRGYLLFLLIVCVMDNTKLIVNNMWVIIVTLVIATMYGLLWFSSAEFSLETLHGVIRVRGFGSDPNVFSISLLGGIPYLLIKLFYTKGFQRWMILGFLMVLMAGLILSYSRSGVVALLFVLAGVVYLERRRPIVWIIITLTLIITIIIVPPNFVNRMMSALTLVQDESISVRIDLWKVAWQMFKANPIDGIGLGQFVAIESGFTHHIESKIAHNMFLEWLVETGVVGFMIFLSILTLCFSNFAHAGKLLKHANPEMSHISYGMLLGLVAFAVSGLFLSNQYYIVLWFYFGMGEVLLRQAKLLS